MNIPPEDIHSQFVVRHQQTAPTAFNHVELALAEAYNDLPVVMKVKQPDTGTFLLKPLVHYVVGEALGGVLGLPLDARYTLKIVVSGDLVTLDFELGREETTEWRGYPPQTEMPKIRNSFRSIAEHVASSVNGTLEEKRQP